MDDKLDKIGETGLNSLINNPFSKNCIIQVKVSYRKRSFDLGWIAEGSIDLKNGNTEATQSFIGDSFDDVTRQIKTFIDNEL